MKGLGLPAIQEISSSLKHGDAGHRSLCPQSLRAGLPRPLKTDTTTVHNTKFNGHHHFLIRFILQTTSFTAILPGSGRLVKYPGKLI
jgi:hypothetical protein